LTALGTTIAGAIIVLLHVVAWWGVGRAALARAGTELAAIDVTLIGWALWLTLLALLHTLLPIDYRALALILLGLALCAMRCVEWRLSRRMAVLVVLLALGAALVSIERPAHYDDGLYFQQSLRWLREYPLVPGLGNLHSRLAYNFAALTHTAALDLLRLAPGSLALAPLWLLGVLAALQALHSGTS
jgi:hypothetical protein